MRTYGMSESAKHGCGCMPDAVHENSEFAVAMAYVPWQNFTTVYDPDKALEVGTIFPELDKPFFGGRGMKRR